MSEPISPCTLDDLVKDESLALRPIGALDRSREVLSVQLFVGPADENRLGAAELVLVVTEAVQDPAEINRLAGVFADAEVAGVAYPETFSTEQQQLWRDALAAAQLPALQIPRTTRFADIIDTVSRAHASPDTARFHRMLSMQQSLAASLSDRPDPITGLVRKLARLTDATVGLVDDTGTVEAATGVLPYRMLRQEIGDYDAPFLQVNVGTWDGIAVRLEGRAQRRQWLIAVSTRANFYDAYLRSAASVTASLIDASRRLDQLLVTQDRAVRQAVLREALQLQPGQDVESLSERLTALGVEFYHNVYIARVDPGPSRQTLHEARRHAALVDTVHAAAQVAAAPVLVSDDGAELTVLIEADPAARDRFFQRLSREEAHLLIGVGRGVDHVGAVPVSAHDATLALRHLARGGDERLLNYADLEFSTRLLADVGEGAMTHWIDRLLAPLLDKPLLMEALRSYFEHGLDIMSTAKALHIHHNSLRYRLSKVEDLVGGALREPAIITALHLALTAAAARTDNPAERPLRPAGTRRRGLATPSAATDDPLEAGLDSTVSDLQVTVPE